MDEFQGDDILEDENSRERARIQDIKHLELTIRTTELNLVKSMSDLTGLIKDHFVRQDTSNELLAQATNRLTDTIETSFREVLGSAMGKNQMPSDMVKLLVKVLGSILLALTFALIFALTGIQLRLLPDFHKAQNQAEINREYLRDLKELLEFQSGKRFPDLTKLEEENATH